MRLTSCLFLFLDRCRIAYAPATAGFFFFLFNFIECDRFRKAFCTSFLRTCVLEVSFKSNLISLLALLCHPHLWNSSSPYICSFPITPSSISLSVILSSVLYLPPLPFITFSCDAYAVVLSHPPFHWEEGKATKSYIVDAVILCVSSFTHI